MRSFHVDVTWCFETFQQGDERYDVPVAAQSNHSFRRLLKTIAIISLESLSRGSERPHCTFLQDHSYIEHHGDKSTSQLTDTITPLPADEAAFHPKPPNPRSTHKAAQAVCCLECNTSSPTNLLPTKRRRCSACCCLLTHQRPQR